MPYILLAIGLLIGLYVLYRFFINANLQQIKAVFLAAIIITLIIALFFMAVTGRLAAALGLGAAILPFVFAYFRETGNPNVETTLSQDSEIKTREDALNVLGLKEEASEKDIQAAYKKLMAKVHPDAEGSEWMAAKLNQARDLLLK